MTEQTPQTPATAQTQSSPQDSLSGGEDVIPKEFSHLAPKEPARLDFESMKPVVQKVESAPKGALRWKLHPDAEDRTIKAENIGSGKKFPMGIEPPPEPTKEEIAFKENLSRLINLEMNIFNSCYVSVKQLVGMHLRQEPADSADLGESMWGPGKRSPLELEEPRIAMEIYKEVRKSMREADRSQNDGEEGD